MTDGWMLLDLVGTEISSCRHHTCIGFGLLDTLRSSLYKRKLERDNSHPSLKITGGKATRQGHK